MRTRRAAVTPLDQALLSSRVRLVPWVFGVATIACQIAYPLTSGDARTRLTVATVVVFLLASVTHAALHRGATAAASLVLVAAGGGLLVEAVGVSTGVPFGDYAYADTLGWQLVDVPVVIPLAWAMMAYPALLVGRALAGRWVPLVGGWALASWDVFLDPQMVEAGHWFWRDPTPGLPGVPGVPLTNFAGWLIVAVAMMALLDRAVPSADARRSTGDALPAALYLWTYASSVLGAAVFFGRPSVALVGGLLMGAVAVPYAVKLWRRRQ